MAFPFDEDMKEESSGSISFNFFPNNQTINQEVRRTPAFDFTQVPVNSPSDSPLNSPDNIGFEERFRDGLSLKGYKRTNGN